MNQNRAQAVETILRNQGIVISLDWINGGYEYLQTKGPISSTDNKEIADKLFRLLLDSDLYEATAALTKGVLGDGIDNVIKDKLQPNQMILQIDEFINVALSHEQRINNDNTKRLHKFFLTDGKRKVIGIEVIPITSKTTDLHIGSKISIHNADIRRGAILLKPWCAIILGGSISRLSSCNEMTVQNENFNTSNRNNNNNNNNSNNEVVMIQKETIPIPLRTVDDGNRYNDNVNNNSNRQKQNQVNENRNNKNQNDDVNMNTEPTRYEIPYKNNNNNEGFFDKDVISDRNKKDHNYNTNNTLEISTIRRDNPDNSNDNAFYDDSFGYNDYDDDNMITDDNMNNENQMNIDETSNYKHNRKEPINDNSSSSKSADMMELVIDRDCEVIEKVNNLQNSYEVKQYEIIEEEEEDFLLPTPPTTDEKIVNVTDIESTSSSRIIPFNAMDIEKYKGNLSSNAPRQPLKSMKEIKELYKNQSNSHEIYYITGFTKGVATYKAKNNKYDISIHFDDCHETTQIKVSSILVEKTLGVCASNLTLAKSTLPKDDYKDYKNNLFLKFEEFNGHFAVCLNKMLEPEICRQASDEDINGLIVNHLDDII